MAARVYAAATIGLEAVTVEVEADIGRSLPTIAIVGLPDTAVQEARERVRAAMKNSGLNFPTTRVTVNLAPGDIRKEGPVYDLPVALAIALAADEFRPMESLDGTLFLGELSLTGELRPVAGVLAAALHARAAGFHSVVVPSANAAEAALVDGLTVLSADCLRAVLRHLSGEMPLPRAVPPTFDGVPEVGAQTMPWDFAHIRGQVFAKRALEVAAAGGHNVRMAGPPGAGKTLLARALATILPPMTKEECLEVTKIYSVSGLLNETPLIRQRPFRSPHHTTSHVALVGGGSPPRPGEVSLAHRGVLFLDEFPEFPRQVLEALRQPVEDGSIVVARAAGTVTFPSRFMLIAAENPCPCGYATDPTHVCTCTPAALLRYRQRVSGPLIDRIDLTITVPRVPVSELAERELAESSATVRERVFHARERQQRRKGATGVTTNAELMSRQVAAVCQPTPEATELLHAAADRLHLSARAYYRIFKVARTIADLVDEEMVSAAHVAEALQYRDSEPR